VPPAEDTVKVDDPETPSDIVFSVRDAVGPFVKAGLTVAFKLTLPENPRRLVRVIVEEPDDPWTRRREPGLETMEKSGGGSVTVTDNEPEWDRPATTPVTVTV